MASYTNKEERKIKRFIKMTILFLASAKLPTQSPILFLYDMEINSSSAASSKSTLPATKWPGVPLPLCC